MSGTSETFFRRETQGHPETSKPLQREPLPKRRLSISISLLSPLSRNRHSINAPGHQVSSKRGENVSSRNIEFAGSPRCCGPERFSVDWRPSVSSSSISSHFLGSTAIWRSQNQSCESLRENESDSEASFSAEFHHQVKKPCSAPLFSFVVRINCFNKIILHTLHNIT